MAPPHSSDAPLKQVTLEKESIGEWFATFGIEMNHDTIGIAVESLDLMGERKRLERKQ